jgi:predicted TIM-barrel fold metal-dependent hydrolase
MRIDSHQHVWTQPLVEALSARTALPRLRHVAEQAVLETAHGGPFVIDTAADSPERRTALVEVDGLDLVLVAISSPVGIEALPRDEASPLIDAHLDGVAAMGRPFAAWGPIPLDSPVPEDVDRVLDCGCVGISLPAGAMADHQRLADLAPVLERVCERGAPLFVHPGPGFGATPAGSALREPTWWLPLTGYVSQMQAAWLTFVTSGRAEHPQLEVVFAMLAGGGPLLAERLSARGGPSIDLRDPGVFYDSSSFGAAAIEAVARLTGFDQLVYGSDRPVVEPVPNWWTVRLQENGGRFVWASLAAI